MEKIYFEQFQKRFESIDLNKISPIIPNISLSKITTNNLTSNVRDHILSQNNYIEKQNNMNPNSIQFFNKDYLNKIAIVKFNGGLGTTMKCNGPKGCMEAVNGLSFLEISIEQIINMNKEFETNIPFVLMNSKFTEEDTNKQLEKYRNKLDIFTFNQNFMHRFNADKLNNGIMELDSSQYPPGTGDFYNSFVNSGIKDTLMKKGIEYIFISNIDNLGATFDYNILSWIIQNEFPFTMELCKRTDGEKKGGAPVMWNDKKHLLEVAQVPENQMNIFTDLSIFPYFNTNNLWIKLDCIIENMPLYVISNPKVVENRKLVQLEAVVGMAFSNFSNSQILYVERNRFHPVKTIEQYEDLKNNYTLDKNFCLQKNTTITYSL
jgi:UTP--glucose-1-phosphate uridylyltransferase